MSGLEVALVQTQLVWHDPAANRAKIEAQLVDIESADLVVLPEMFSTGFTMASSEMAESMQGPTLQWLQAQADRFQFALCGSLIIEHNQQHFNRFVLVEPNTPVLFHYDKRHLFRMADEHQYFTPGTQRQTFELAGHRICPQVCYDLRFPVFSRNQRDYDCLLVVANWPAARQHHWRTLLTARAIENQCYVVAVNRIGTDGNGISYVGDSGVIDPQGNWQLDLADSDRTASAQLSLDAVLELRERFPAWRDADEFTINLD